MSDTPVQTAENHVMPHMRSPLEAFPTAVFLTSVGFLNFRHSQCGCSCTYRLP